MLWTMPSGMEDIVKSFRQLFEISLFSLGQASAAELESWLSCPGSDRVYLLQWCLGQLNPALRERFQNCDTAEAEKRTIKLVQAFGLSHDERVILGTAPQKEQTVMWQRMLLLFKAAKRHSSKADNSQYTAVRSVLSSLCQSEDFTDLLHTNVKLLPAHFSIAATDVRKKHVEETLQSVALELQQLQVAESNLSSDDDYEDYEKSNMDCSMKKAEEYREVIFQNVRKIQECYEHLDSTLFPAVKRQPESPLVEMMGSCFDNLGDNITAFVQMLQDVEETHKNAEILERSSVLHTKDSEVSELLQLTSECHSIAKEILSIWRLHNII